MDLAFAVISDVLNASFGADERVVAFRIGGVVTLHVAGLCSVFQLHHDHIVVFHVDDRGETGLFKRRIVVFVPAGAAFGVFGTAFAFVVDGEHSHSDDLSGVASHQPVHDVDVVRALLKKQSGGVFLFGMPVAEIGVAAVVDEVTAPAALDVADGARVNDFFHFENGGEVAHIVTDEQFRAGFVRGAQNAVAAFNRDCHRFFEENGFSRLKRGNRLFFMAVIRRGDHDGINFLDFQQIGVIVKHLCFRELFMESIACGGFRIGSGNDFPTLFRLVHLPTVSAPSANGD